MPAAINRRTINNKNKPLRCSFTYDNERQNSIITNTDVITAIILCISKTGLNC